MERMSSPQRWDEVLVELYELAGSPGVRVVEDYARRDPDAGSLSKSTVGELLKGKANPRRASVEAFVLGCLYYARTRRPPVVLPEGQDVSGYWMDRYDQAAGADTSRRRSAAVRNLVTEGAGWRLKPVAACTPADVGVHPTERREGAPEDVRWWEDLPEYLPRDHDNGLQRRLHAASTGGGFVVVVGDSATGKTRSLYEAVRTVLRGWHVLLPHDPVAISDASGRLPPRTVVWLDDTPTERFLTEDTRHGLTKTQLLQLIERASGGPVVVVDVLWRTRYEALAASPATDNAAMSADQYRNTRDALSLAGDPVMIDSWLSPAEKARAIQITVNTRDRRWQEALDDYEFGAVQHLAGAPELIHRWRHADPYTGAVISAALDACRMGVRTSLSCGLLRDAADGYLTGRTRASAPADWFKTALTMATQPRKGTTAPLIPTSDPTGRAGAVAGYSVADYLLQHGLRERSWNPTPVALWGALTDYVTDVGDLGRLLSSARERMLYHWADLLYHKAVRSGLSSGAYLYTDQLINQGRFDEAIEHLCERIDASDTGAFQVNLVRLLAKAGHEQELRELMSADDDHYRKLAHEGLSDLLREQGREEPLRELANAGNAYASLRLAELLTARKNVADAISHLERAESGGVYQAVRPLAGLLIERGRVTEAIDLLQGWAAAGEFGCTQALIDILLAQGRLGDAIDELRHMAYNGHTYATEKLIELLIDRGDVEEAVALLREQVSGVGDRAARTIAKIFREQRREDDLWELTTRHKPGAALELAALLVEQGRDDELIELSALSGGYFDVNVPLNEQIQEDELKDAADADEVAAQQWALLPVKSGHLDEARWRLQRLMSAGHNNWAAAPLARILAGSFRADPTTETELRFGLNPDGSPVEPHPTTK